MNIDRAALYYPYIHIRSEYWLKATLLNFPKVYRMVPFGHYVPEDDKNIQPYTQYNNDIKDCLLDNSNTASASAISAQQELLTKLKEHKKRLTTYRKRTGMDRYYIHDEKLDDEFKDYLLSNKLAWPDKDSQAKGHRNWLGLHPKLGSAVMSTLAIAIAAGSGRDIVTNSNADHETLISTNTDDIIDRLLGIKTRPNKPEGHDTQNQLGQLVITRSINLNALTIDDIIELKANNQDFRSFRHLLLEHANDIGNIADPSEREKRLTERAKELVQAWHDYKNKLPRRIARTLFTAAGISAPAIPGAVPLAAAATITVGFIAYKTRKIYKEYQDSTTSPYRYLSTIAGKENQKTKLAYPLGLATTPTDSIAFRTPRTRAAKKN
jgi:hypothetical protein